MADLEYTIKSSGGDSKAIKDVTAAIKESSKATQESNVVNVSAAEAAKILKESEKELKEQKKGLIDQLKILKNELPGLGEVIHLVKNPIVALSIGILAVIDAFNKYIEKVKQAEEAMAPFENISAQFGNFRHIAVEAMARGEEFQHSLKRLAVEAASSGLAFDRINTALERNAHLAGELRTIQQELSTALLDQAVAEGKITEAQAARQKIAMGGSAAARAAALAEGQAKAASLHGRISAEQSNKAGLEAQLPAASAASDAASIGAIHTKALAQDTIDEATKSLPELKKQLAAAEAEPTISPSHPFAQLTKDKEKKVADLQEKIATAIKNRDDALALIAETDAKIAQTARDEKELREDIKASTKKLADMAAQRVELEAGLLADWLQDKKLSGIEGRIAGAKSSTATIGAIDKLSAQSLTERGELQNQSRQGAVDPALYLKYQNTNSQLGGEVVEALQRGITVSQELLLRVRQAGLDIDALRRQIQNVQ